ncbi:Na/Pi symporter [Draconibacterium sp.]|nr:Na/Pi symporter [Draconibacterium sp.]
MQQTLLISGMLAGGLGLFLLAVTMITDGLKSAAGDALRGLLANWTRSPLHGIFTGLMITAIVQSSSAVTVATIGFVNAGLIGMRRALGIVYGSNIGTTMTGWLVAIIGFKINVDAFALPMIGIGMLLHLTGGEGKRAPIGLALAGFGLFFIGIDVLKDAFEGLVTTIDLGGLAAQGIGGILSFVGIGFLMTVLTQSSSAAIALTLTAASGGAVDINAAAAMVIGANVGTTSTAAIAVIGATSNARRVASAHIIFNVVTGVVALLILPLLFWIVTNAESFFGLEANPAVTLAMFHSVFNLLGVLLMYPLNDRLASFLERRFVTQEESESLPRYLDKTVAVSPDLAVNALMLEMQRVAGIARTMALQALGHERSIGKRMASNFQALSKLAEAIADFVAMIARGVLGRDISEQLRGILSAGQYLLIGAEEAVAIVREQTDISALGDIDLQEMVSGFHAEAIKLVQLIDPEDAAFSYADCVIRLEQMQIDYESVKFALMQAGSELRVPIPLIIDIVDQNSRIRRMCRQLVRAMGLLDEIPRIGNDERVDDSPPEIVDESDS